MGVGSGAASGAGTGAALGSMFGPGPGTAIGAAAGGVIGGIGGWLKGRAQKKGAEEESRLYNRFLDSQRAASGQVIDAAGGMGALLGPQTRTGSKDFTNFMNQNSTARTVGDVNKTFTGGQGQESALLNRARARMEGSNLASRGQQMRDMSRINRFFDPKLGAGLPGGIGVAGARMGADNARRMALADRAGQFEDDSRKLQLQAEGGVSDVLKQLFEGQHTDQTTRTRMAQAGGGADTTSETGPADPRTLAMVRDFLAGSGPRAGKETGISPWGDAASAAAGAAPILGSLVDQYRRRKE
jgi:hypothetical protein